MMKLLAALLWLAAAVQCEELQESLDHTTVLAKHGEVFSIILNSSLLSGAADNRANDTLRFSPSLLGAPDLPDWLSYGYSEQLRCGVVYGVPPPHLDEFRLEIIVTNLRTYQTSRREVHVLVSDSAESLRHEVQLKINNMDPVDLLFDSSGGSSSRKQPRNASNIEKLQEIFQQVLWPAAGADVRLTWLSVADPGPVAPRPGAHLGTLLRLASGAPFSPQLRFLQQEVRPLWARVPCPRNFKRSKFERHFRERDFKMDWCQFKLFESGELALLVDEPAPTAAPPPPPPSLADVLPLPARVAVPARSYVSDFLTTIGIPLLVALLLCATLTCIMCCQGEHLETDSDGEFFDNVFSVFVRRRPAEIQMVQYPGGSSSLPRGVSLPRSQTSTLRRAALRDVSPRLAEQSEYEPSSRREASLLRDVSPRLTPYREPLSPEDSVPATPDSERHAQRQPPPYRSLSRRS
ncbi:alpha-sarcoglycan-like isoform X1 [Amphibalanus amphitrite]|uniref:alpha-sarcoglycan-like isoform X1 n=1 Tax=Amphibalanus amphitrite TaxID=1232801 RepID=UPI001C9254AF|nr:alpha-sarcoglycan-like isoform X1 [Amphibalanus amphitrite]XP_043244936.1 alpha-sarcoglycan-like isoform X1 [Amphibalanus amphitrite]